MMNTACAARRSHTVNKSSGPDKIFRISGMAKARAAEVGKENITNATTGAFLDGSGQLAKKYMLRYSLNYTDFLPDTQ